MKNIHVLPTDKPSKLYFNHNKGFEKYQFSKEPFINGLTNTTNQHIYITNSEEIKEGQYYIGDGFSGKNKFKWHKSQVELYPNIKKDIIILTTDQDLIKDGVQAIPDGFLEWFVDNPSCENVGVEKEQYHTFVGMKKYPMIPNYKIIIPSKDDLKIGDNTNFGIITDINEKSVCFGKNKVGVDVWYKKSYVVKFPNLVLKEPKQETQGYICPHTKLHCDDECCVSAEDCHIEAGFGIVSDCEPPKQETLEEAKKYAELSYYGDEVDAFVRGVKWQQEQDKNMYSEEDMRKMYDFGSIGHFTENESLEQFKKK